MNQILGFILGLAVGGVAAWFFLKRKTSQGEATPASVRQPADFGEVNQFEKKEENLKKILEALEGESFGTAQDGNARISNDEVEQMLKVSNATAERYLDELEKQGKIRQVGKTGRYTYYEKIR